MTRRTRPAARRGGGTLPETALLLGFFLMFLMGIFEYTRYLFTLTVATNAARDAARYASVNVSNQLSAFAGTSITNDPKYTVAGGRPTFTVPAIGDYCLARMGGAEGGLRAQTGTDGNPVAIYQIFPCDSKTLFVDPPTIQPKVQPDSTATPPITTATWNNSRFTERIAVRIVGRYDPIAPGMLFLTANRLVDIVVVMGSEG